MSQEEKTEFRRVHYQYRWKVEDYFAKEESAKTGDAFDSPVFTVVDPLGKAEDSRFHLSLYPKGETDSPGHVGLYLTNDGPEARVKYSVFMVGVNEEKLVVRSSDRKLERNQGWGWSKFCTLTENEDNADNVNKVVNHPF